MADLDVMIETPFGPATISGRSDGERGASYLIHMQNEKAVAVGGGTLKKFDPIWAGSTNAACHKYLYDHNLTYDQKQSFNAVIQETFTNLVRNLPPEVVATLNLKASLHTIQYLEKNTTKAKKKIAKLEASLKAEEETLRLEKIRAEQLQEFLAKGVDKG
jgi:hypothetical protein